MPTYDYQCQACGHEWELFQSMNDSPVKSCPKCKKRKAKRLLGLGAGLIFKGTGFYETDYKNKTGGESKKKIQAIQNPHLILEIPSRPARTRNQKKRQNPNPNPRRLKPKPELFFFFQNVFSRIGSSRPRL